MCNRYTEALRSAIHHRNSMFQRRLEDYINDNDAKYDKKRYFEECSD